jgi:hypothetical protein
MTTIAAPVTATTANDSHKKNRIQVSNTKKPLFFYVNLAKVHNVRSRFSVVGISCIHACSQHITDRWIKFGPSTFLIFKENQNLYILQTIPCKFNGHQYTECMNAQCSSSCNVCVFFFIYWNVISLMMIWNYVQLINNGKVKTL